MLQKMMRKNDKGFTLIELMIVIAIIGILAAIAVPQFLTYRLRSYNTAAKGIVHNLKADQGNLNAELDSFGNTETLPAELDAAYVGPGESDSSVQGSLRLAATADRAGARLSGRIGTPPDNKDYSIGISLGDNMIAYSRGLELQHFVVARHLKGDTAYGLDSDVENQLYSVSNPNWPGNNGMQATYPTSCSDADDFIVEPAGGGAPTANWMPTQ